jgi:peptidoglycan/xylan/chitin deacetylase (PgdA/CDA1 family)
VVITFHRVTETNTSSLGLNDFIEIRQDKFEAIIKDLKKLGSSFVSLSQFEQSVYDSVKREPIVHISFDDGYSDNYTHAFPILKKHNICFSIFVVSDFIDNSKPFLWWYLIENIVQNEIAVLFKKYDFKIDQHTYSTISKEKIFEQFRDLLLANADMDTVYFKAKLFDYSRQGNTDCMPGTLSWVQINEMVESGLCEIGVHTKTHPRFRNLTPAKQIEEITECKLIIKEQTGVDAKYFSYPYGSITDIGSTDSINEVMKACDIQMAFTTQSAELNSNSNKYLVPREFLNNSATAYTIKTRLTGAYQRSITSS